MGGLALTMLSAVVAMAQPPAAPPDRDADQIRGEFRAPPGTNVTMPGPFGAGQYWLGIECLPVMPALRTQLNLPEKQGLLGGAGGPEGPAAKAGILQHDILLRVGDHPLSGPRDLVQAVEAAKGATLKIELIRGGKPKTIEATPAKRPNEARRMIGPPPESADWDTVQKWLEGMWGREEGQAEHPPVGFRLFGPGVIVPKDVLIPRPLPPDMSVIVSKESNQPAKIVVKRGDQKWEVTERELDKLPADVRPFVEGMLGRNVLGIVGGPKGYDVVPDVMQPGAPPPSPGGHFQAPAPPPGMMQVQPLPMDPRLEKRLDEIERRMDKLFQAIQKLGVGRSQQPAPAQHEGK
jgi:hypothetical protein